jgi:hypothetical protein
VLAARRLELVMSVARSVADILAEHVSFEVECIDRMYCNVYVPQLQYPAGLAAYVHHQLGLPIASTAPLAAMTDRFAKAVHVFARQHQIPWVDFVKGQRKDDVMHEQLAAFRAAGRTEGVVFIGRAQEKTAVFRTEKRRNPTTGRSYPWIVRSTGIINHFYVYCFDDDFGPFFLKFCGYFPYTAKLCFNGHHWAQRQAAKAGVGFVAMDNAFAAVDDTATLQQICNDFDASHIEALLGKWLDRLPNPFSDADRAAGYRYKISVLQAEFSLTQMLDAPVTGRVFFEHVIRDNLDVGRADKVGLIFDRRIRRRGPHPTPGRFQTRVITAGVTPTLHLDYQHTTIKQYHKEGRALRTETTINETRDFGIGKGLGNLPALRQIGFSANRRLLDVQRLDHDPIAGSHVLHTVTDPVHSPTGSRIPGLPIGQPRSHALLSALLIFRTHLRGFTNADLRRLVEDLRGLPPGSITTGQTTYDLRRLRTHGLIQRRPHSNRYDITDTGLRVAMLLTRINDRLLPAALSQQTGQHNTRLRRAADAYQHALDNLAQRNGIAA